VVLIGVTMTKKLTFRIGIVGCGLIGKKRAEALLFLKNTKLIGCTDVDILKAKSFAVDYETIVFDNWKKLINSKLIDIVFIATHHNSLSEISSAAINSGKHVLVEKPGAIKSSELKSLTKLANKKKVKVKVGYNHRYHRSFIKAKEIIDNNSLGQLMFIRGRYGHGGRLGYEKEWRSNLRLSGGGELIDQGSHLIDLCKWILGDLRYESGFAHTYFWNSSADDNTFMILKSKHNQTAFLHASCTEWKNLFSMEIYGKKGKIDINGLGGSYGLEKITWYKMLPEMGPPDTICWEYPTTDQSWSAEIREFLKDIEHDRKPSSSLEEATKTLKIIEEIYFKSGIKNE